MLLKRIEGVISRRLKGEGKISDKGSNKDWKDRVMGKNCRRADGKESD